MKHNSLGWDAPWEEEEENTKNQNARAERVVERLKRVGFDTGGETNISLDTVAAVFRTWDEEFRAEIPELLEEDEEDDWDITCSAAQELLLICPEGRIRLDRDGVLTIVEAREKVFLESFERSTALGPRPNDFSELGNWAAARASLGDDQTALQALAYLQEQGGDTHLPNLHFNRAGIFRRHGKVQKAIKEMQRSVELKKQTYEFSAANDLICLAELHLEDGNQEEAKAAVLGCLQCLKALTEQPRKTFGCGSENYQYETSRGTTFVPRDTLVYDVQRAISLVKRMEAEDPVEAEKLSPIKAEILAVRQVLEQHW
ncbi:MAG: hypothetical protein O3B01_31880 [Planctomycetota bacterium]|nr:hypothetical protein [Planctomycetota bacterium]MDA1143183.1 hypothetical protein [Planctomycetota bacterium]